MRHDRLKNSDQAWRKQRIAQQPLSRQRRAGTERGGELTHLPCAQILSGDRLGQPLAVPSVGARQRDQAPHSGMAPDRPPADQRLDRLRQRLYQRQPPPDPAHRTILGQGHRQRAHLVALGKLLEQPALLQRRAVLSLPAVAEDQRLRLGTGQLHRLHGVPA